MVRGIKPLLKSLVLIIAVGCIAGPGTLSAEEKRDMGGWGKSDPYNKLYNAAEMDSIKGTVVGIEEIFPLQGMAPGVALLVRESKKDVITVHLGPSWFMNRNNIGIKKGDEVKVRGAWAEISGKDIFIASKVKKGDDFELKVRLTKDGTPFWTLSPEELAKERASQ